MQARPQGEYDGLHRGQACNGRKLFLIGKMGYTNIGFRMPPGARTGLISVTVAGITSASAAVFRVNPWIGSSPTASSSTEVLVTMSEAINPATVQNTDFSISGLDVTGAALQPDGVNVVLTCAPQVPAARTPSL